MLCNTNEAKVLGIKPQIRFKSIIDLRVCLESGSGISGFAHFILTAEGGIGVGSVDQVNNEALVIQTQTDTAVSQLSDDYQTLLGRHFDGNGVSGKSRRIARLYKRRRNLNPI